MKVWIFNHYASTPDQPMTGAYFLAKAFAKRGHSVAMFASSFSYYKRREIRLKKWELSKEQDHEGLTYLWIRTLPHTPSLWSRSLNMLSYFIMSIFIAMRRRERPDVIIGTCPHLLGVLAAYLVSVIKRSRFVFEIRDLWPQTFVDSGALKDQHIVVVLLRHLERFLFQKASLIISVFPFVHEYVAHVGISPNKVVWIPNGLEIPEKAESGVAQANPSENHILMYIGGHAKYHGIDTILKAAKIIQDNNMNHLKFVFIGDGVEKPRLIRYSDELGLKNVEFRDLVPRSDLSFHLKEASILIFHLKEMGVLHKYGISPNKLCDYLVEGKPIICAVNGRNNPVEEAGAGICIPPENPSLMAEAVQSLLKLPTQELEMMGKRGFQYALKNYDIRALAARLEGTLSSLLS